MKRSFLYVFLCVVVTSFMVSCDEIDISFDESLLIGKWQSGTVYYKYLVNGSGATWDEADDVTEEEAQTFTWTLEYSELTHIHVLEMGGTVPKAYTVTELTSTTLRYKDDFGKTFTFTKVAS